MCKACQTKPVYEFTNKRKLCRRCFINYFQKKVLYIIRKFKMISRNDIIGYYNGNNFRNVVLEDILKMFEDKLMIDVVELPARYNSQMDNKSLIKKQSVNSFVNSFISSQRRAIPNKIAIPLTIDSTAYGIINELIEGKIKNLKEVTPVKGKVIKPLYLFLDKEVLLYAKLKKLKFKKIKKEETKISKFIDDLEKKHPEVKRAVVNSLINKK